MLSYFTGIFTAHPSVLRKTDISYVDTDSPDYDNQRHRLNVYTPVNAQNCDVLIFVHGGEWDSGDKNLYGRIGSHFANKEVAWVSINYRLAPKFNYKDMAFDVARAVKWVYESISDFGGNPSRIFLSGHSAGGYLSALTGLDNQYFKQAEISNPLKGLILIDSFLLDLYEFFTITDPDWARKYYDLFGSKEQEWRTATPMFYLNGSQLPIRAFLGSKTYPGILLGNDRFRKQCELAGKDYQLHIIRGKAHRAMITQLFFSKNNMYHHIIDFMKNN
ncbi:alpha/beta hydrolase [Solitalea lacus]|uniref:alpha/beta hydrolase n=1 Tax=Solitalea lacus TaxID=2911172 RepID=UPI001EDC0A01|nr:alpha/beta hydrolase [Solitalea lacus]UKJ06139.1 alpha/beta hydrolase [Solitalea lacus]